MHLLLPDTWHFHRRNFAALFDVMRDRSIPYTVERSRRALWKAHGDYRDQTERLARHLDVLKGLDPGELRLLEHRGVNLWKVARPELMCLLLPRARWRDGAGPNEPEAVLRRAWADPADHQDLMLCMAAARDWVAFWDDYLALHPELTHAMVFSGAYIYTRALQEVGDRHRLRLFALESFFTGHEFYCEERITPLPNASLLGDAEWYGQLQLPDDPDACDRLRAEAHRRLRTMRNKNVKAASGPVPRFFANDAPTVLILGQVLNDFSIIGTALPELSSLAVYREMIGGLLAETGLNVIFKAHPWERRRPHLMGPVTLDSLREFAATLPADQQARLRLIEAEPVKALFGQVDHVVAICSQGLIEAAQAGLKPIQIGRAFFGNKGFTHDLPDAAAVVKGLRDGTLDSRLTLDGYRLFEDFLVRALTIHLVGNDGMGRASLLPRLANEKMVPRCPDVARMPTRDAAQVGRRRLMMAEMIDNPVPWLRDGWFWLRRRR